MFKVSFGRDFFLQINSGVIVVGLINDHVFFFSLFNGYFNSNSFPSIYQNDI